MVEITLSKNNEIDSIINPISGIGLSINKNYDIINKKELNMEKIKIYDKNQEIKK